MDVSVAEIRMDLSGHYTFFLGIKISLYPKDRNTNCCFVAVVPSPETWKTYPINAPAVGEKPNQQLTPCLLLMKSGEQCQRGKPKEKRVKK